MKRTRKIKKNQHPSVIKGFTLIRGGHYWPTGYYLNRGLRAPLDAGELGCITGVRFING